MTPQEVAEYVIWYARKVKGPAGKVAQRLLEEFPWLRESLLAATTQPETGTLDVRRVVKAIENVAARHGIKKDPPMPLALARIYGYSTTPDDMDAQIAAEYAALAEQESKS